MLRDVPFSGFYRHPSITLSGIGINRITVRMTSYFNCGRSGSISETLRYAISLYEYEQITWPVTSHKYGQTALTHPWRPRGSQSGREKRRDKSFQAQVKKPLGMDSHRIISKQSSKCWLLIGHKKCFVLLCPISKQFLLSSFHDTTAIFSPQLPGLFTKLSLPEMKMLSMSQKTGCYQQEQFNLH